MHGFPCPLLEIYKGEGKHLIPACAVNTVNDVHLVNDDVLQHFRA